MLLVFGAALAGVARAQEPAEAKPEEPAAVHGRLLLVLPFENKSGVTSLDWVGEAFPEVLNRRLNSAGFLTISRGDRLYAFDHLGLPLTLEPSRATAIRIAQTLDADYVVFGHYTLTGNTIQATAEVLDVGALRLGNPLQAQGDLDAAAADDQRAGVAGDAADRSNVRRGAEHVCGGGPKRSCGGF